MQRRGHAVDTDRPLAEAFADADVLITDVSSLAVEWLPIGRPLIVTVPAEAGAVVTPSPLLDQVPRLTAAETGEAGRLVRRCLAEDPERDRRRALVDHYLGGADPAEALVRFLAACDDVIRARDAAQAPVRAEVGPVTADRPAWPTIAAPPRGHAAARHPRPADGGALDRRPLHAADLAVPHPAAAPRGPDGERGHRADDRHRRGLGLRPADPGAVGRACSPCS